MNLEQGYLERSLPVPQLRDKALIYCNGRRTKDPVVSSVVMDEEQDILKSLLLLQKTKERS